MALSHSFSSLKMYENCPLRYYHQRIVKSVVDKGGEASIYGERIHKSLELRLKDQEQLTQEAAAYEPIAQAIESTADGGELFAEQQLALTEELRPTTWFAKDAWIRSILDVLVIRDDVAYVYDFKGLALDTLIPTPTGWTTMGEIKVGDKVFDANGEQCSVVGKSQVKNIKCFEVTFNGTTKVVCDEEHLWKLCGGKVIGVQELMGTRNQRQRIYTPRISVAAPLALADVDLPIDPYVLGLWLADGKHSSGEISKPDTFIWEEIMRRGYQVNMETGMGASCPTRTVKGLRTQLIAHGLFKNKHIPEIYLRAGYQQRVDLLRGLMDGDGNANPARRQAVFSNTNKQLSDSVCELLSSLGQRPLQSAIRQHGFGKTVTSYVISFRPIGFNPFSLPRKANRVYHVYTGGIPTTRYVSSVKEIPSVPTQCIAVDSNDHTFLCTERMIPTHNTGKRRPDFTQLELFALQVFAHHKQINKVRSAFIWLKDSAMDSKAYERDDAPMYWGRMLARIRRIEQSVETDTWPARPSGLCKFCPARHLCDYAQ